MFKDKRINRFDVKLNTKSISAIVLVIVLIILMLLFKVGYERVLVFGMLYLLCLLITKNILYSLFSSIILFAIINLMIKDKIFVENFENELEDEVENYEDDDYDKETFVADEESNEENIKDSKKDSKKDNKRNNKKDSKRMDNIIMEEEHSMEVRKASNNIKDMLKKANGGIKLSDEDLIETGPVGINTEHYSNDKRPNALRDAQMETYALIDTVSALKDTIETLNPVLSEGKKLMNMFESVKL